MSFRNSIILAVCSIFVLLTVTALFAMNLWNMKNRLGKLEEIQTNDNRQLESFSSASKPQTVTVVRKDTQETIKRLRKLLEERTEIQRKQKSQLIHRTHKHDQVQSELARLQAEHEELRRKYNQLWSDADSSLQVISEMWDSSESESDSAIDPSLDESDSSADGVTDENAPTESESSELRVDMAVRDWELQQALEQINELEASANQLSQISNAASMVLSEMGPTSVPFLVTLLNEREQPAIRTWAAWVLGNIGPSAAEAREPLMALLIDADPQLVQTAEQALAKIIKQ